MLVATLLLSILIGISLGLLGGGGSILTVPILVYVAGQDPKAAIAMSLLVVGVTSAAGAITHARAGRVQWRTGLIFGAAGMAGAYGGGRVAEFIPGDWLLVAFGLMMAATAYAMLRGRPPKVEGHRELAVGKVIIDGVVVGLVTGLVGAGGGFLVVPALVLLGGVPMATAVGTSLVVIAMKSAAGLAGYLASTQIDWGLALGVTVAAILGSFVGGRWAGRIPQGMLRRGFGWFVVAMAVLVLGQQVPAGAWAEVPGNGLAWIGVGIAISLAVGAWDLSRHRHGAGDHATGEVDAAATAGEVEEATAAGPPGADHDEQAAVTTAGDDAASASTSPSR